MYYSNFEDTTNTVYTYATANSTPQGELTADTKSTLYFVETRVDVSTGVIAFSHTEFSKALMSLVIGY